MASGEDKPKPEPKKDTTDPAPVPPNPVILEDSKQEPSTFKVTLEEVITFEDFAKKYNTDTKTLNELNGWDLPAAIPLARGSEVNVPK